MKLLQSIAEETAAQEAQIFLWAPVFLGAGIGLYFALPFEPPLWPALCALIFTLYLLVLSRARHGWRAVAVLLFLAALGFAAAEARARLVYTPMLERAMGPVRVTATVESVEDLEEGKGQRLLLDDPIIENIPPAATPVKIRLTKRREDDFSPGQRVTLLAQLNPPSPPVAPGAFDFQRYMYFQRIGAVGFIYKTIKIDPAPEHSFSDFIEKLRDSIDVRMRRVIAPPAAPMSIAFVTGHRGAISEDDNDAMRNSGLAHLISISGIHIGLFSAFIFFTARFLMACVPGMALRHPIKKYAAVFGFAGAAFYTLLAGGSVPTIRSLIMTALVYAAIMIDRSPLSTRLLAAAAFILLLMTPEALVTASFQMSFAAMLALVVFYEETRPQWSAWYSGAGAARRFLLYFAGSCVTTIIASAATAPFSLFHFQQFAMYGLIANALAAPVTSFVIMPAIVVSLFAMPLGLSWAPLKVLEAGITVILWIAHWTASLPGAALHVCAWPLAALAMMAGGGLFMTLWRGHARWAGIAPVMGALLLIAAAPQPDISIADDFSLMAYREGDILYASSLRKNKFARENWERILGLAPGAARAWPKEGRAGGMMCDAEACRLELKGRRVSFVKKEQAAERECAWADLTVFSGSMPAGMCEGRRFMDRRDGHDSGAQAIYIDGRGLRVESARDYRGERFWTDAN